MSKNFSAKINIQNPPKAKPKEYYIRLKDESSDPRFTVLDWEYTFDKREDSFGTAEGKDPKLNFRRAFIPEAGHLWVSCDFAGQELKIVANLSGEKRWIDAFRHGEDIHKATAEAIWGKENYKPELRKAAKTINFAVLYGTGAKSLGESLGVTEKEAQGYIDSFFIGLPNIKKLFNRMQMLAERNGEVTNLYGRKRRLKQYINRWGKITPAGKRRSVNFPVQSMGAEIVKIALIKIYDNILTNEKYKDKVLFMSTIHDEINFSVDPKYIEEAVSEISKNMNHTIPGRPIPVETDIEIGTSMGLLWGFTQDKETLKLTPQYTPI